MDQISFADAEYAGKTKKARREVFIEEMKRVLPDRAALTENLRNSDPP